MKIQRRIGGCSRAGFSLVELMVVVVIIGLLATVVVPNVLEHLRRAKRETAKVEIRQLENAADTYVIFNGDYPGELKQLVESDGMGAVLKEHSLRDPWKTDYAYDPSSLEGDTPWIASYAADRAPGGEGWDEDIVNWTMNDLSLIHI